MEHEFYTGLSLAAMGIYAVKKFGPAMGNWLDKEVEKVDLEMNAGRTESIQAAKDAIAVEKKEQERAAASKMLFDAKRENVALQLEAAYRANLLKVYNEVISISLKTRFLQVSFYSQLQNYTRFNACV